MNDYIGIDGLLSHLDGVRRTGNGRWMAKSPTRSERTASMSIRLLDDGRILLHDFGGDDFLTILSALGLEPIQLIPDHLRHHRAEAGSVPAGQRFSAWDALRALAHDALLILIAAGDVRRGRTLTDDDMDALAGAESRIDAALSAVGVRHG